MTNWVNQTQRKWHLLFTTKNNLYPLSISAFKKRKEEINQLEADVAELQSQIKPLLGHKPEPKLFIKPKGWEEVEDIEKLEKKAKEINRWGIYNAFR